MTKLRAVAKALLPRQLVVKLLARRAIARGHNPELALLPYFNQGGMFVDVGANIGDFSRVGCLKFSRVLAIEPIPELAQKLREELPDNVEVLCVALSDAPGTAQLYVPVSHGTMTTGLASLDRGANSASGFREITVDLQTLDELGLIGVDLIKIDVEGLEEAVLRGGMATLTAQFPGLIIEIEDRHHPGRTPAIFKLLQDIGYRPYYYRNGRLAPVRGIPTDPRAYNFDELGNYIVNFILIHSKRSYSELESLICPSSNSRGQIAVG